MLKGLILIQHQTLNKLIKYKIWKLLNLYNDMNQIFIQYNIKKLKTIIYSCDDSLENNVDFVLSSCAFKSLTEFYNENNLKYENNMQFKYYDILVKAHYLSYSIIKYINNLDPYSNMIDLRSNLLELLDQDIKISYNLYTSLSKIFKSFRIVTTVTCKVLDNSETLTNPLFANSFKIFLCRSALVIDLEIKLVI